MLKYFFLFLLLLLLTQLTHIHEARHNCHYQRSKDLELLSKDICYNLESRLKFKKEVDCDGAEKRLRENLVLCIFKEWWENTDVYNKIYVKLTESYFAILGVLVPICLGGMYFWSNERNHKYTVDALTYTTKKDLLRLK